MSHNNQSSDALAWRKNGTALASIGRYEEALKIFADALSRDDKSAWIWARYADLLGRLHRDEEAIDAYRLATTLDPRFASAWAQWLRSTAPKPGFAEAWFAVGEAQRSRRYDKKAINAYKCALALNSKFLSAWLARADVLLNHGRLDAALASYDQAFKIDGNLARAWKGRGMALYLMEMGHREEALEAFEQVTTLDAWDVETWNLIGFILHGFHRNEEALAAYDRAVAIDAENVEAWHGMSSVLFALRKTMEATDAYRRWKTLLEARISRLLGR
jgi:tetratricopeptide (TPR) repeat protein